MADLKTIRVAAASLNEIPLDWNGNKERIIKAITAAKKQKASILCLPELCISGYGCEDMFHAVHVHETSLRVLAEILPETDNIIVALSLPLSFRGAVYNAVALVANREILGFTAKQNLASEGVHYEPRWFKPWKSNKRVDITISGKTYPLGDIMYDIGGLRIGFEICQDAWVAKRTGVGLAERGVDIILNPSASHFAFGKFQVRKQFVAEACRAFGVGYIYTNCLGNSAGRIIYDGETLIAVPDKFLAQSPRFSFEEYQLAVADIDISALRMKRARSSQVADSTNAIEELEVKAEFNFYEPDGNNPLKPMPEPKWLSNDNIKEEEFARAVGLGLFDYMRKSRAKGFVVGLSGGADSASTACLVYLMVQLAVAELGLDKFKKRLGYYHEIQELNSVEEIMQQMLYCMYQYSAFSSKTTRKAATNLAKGINASFSEFKVQDIVDIYVQNMAKIVGREIKWPEDDIALQNIQARVRGPSAWLLANLRGSILLATGNRSEAAVGYTTMDGDTCGGLSPIGGIDKAYLLRWLKWLQTTGPEGIGPLPSLSGVTSHPPTAELRPAEYQQTDEADLMPYTLLDIIERLAIQDKLSPLEILQKIRSDKPEIDANELVSYIEKFFNLWSHNQWKRERYAPSFHVDDQNLDPKSWCRFPILSGEFKRELEILRQFKHD